MIHWLLQSLDDCPTILDQPLPEWLDEQEQQRLGTLKVEKRRRDWLLGRWTAKQLVQRYLSTTTSATVALAALHIANAEDGSPSVQWSATDEPLPLELTISHSHGHAFCAVVAVEASRGGQPSLGCDIEFIERRDASFVSDFFTRDEMAAVAAAAAPETLVTAIWSGKESVLKALRTGLRIDTRRITCRFVGEDAPLEWTPFEAVLDVDLAAQVRGGGERWSCWWRVHEQFVLTMALREVT